MRTPSSTFRSTLLTTCLAIATAACSSYQNQVEELPPLTATAAPAWDEPQTGVASPSGDPEFVEIHLDVSSPMAGYIPPGGDGDLSVFQFVAQNAAQHMARVYGNAEAPVRWVGVGHELRSLGVRPQIERRIFDGRSTQLDRSMDRILGNFRTGRAEAAALVSDLMATGDVTGPLTLFGSLSEWLRVGGRTERHVPRWPLRPEGRLLGRESSRVRGSRTSRLPVRRVAATLGRAGEHSADSGLRARARPRRTTRHLCHGIAPGHRG